MVSVLRAGDREFKSPRARHSLEGSPQLEFELEAGKRCIACLRLFSQVLLMFKPISLAVWCISLSRYSGLRRLVKILIVFC